MMEFKNLKASMMHNSNEKASIYMAITLVRSLFKDIAEESGSDELSNAPMGNGENDERLPNEIIWISNQILKIYKSKSDDLNNNRTRLDSVIKNLDEKQGELEDLRGISKELTEKLAEQKTLTAQLQNARATKEEYERVSGVCEKMKEELKTLEGFQPEQKKKELSELEKKILGLRENSEAIEKSLDVERSKLEEAKQNYDKNKQKYDILVNENGELVSIQADLNENIKRTSEEIESLKNRESLLKDKCQYLVQEKKEYEDKVDKLYKEVDDYKTKYLNPVQEKCKEIENEKQNLDEQKEEAERRLRDLSEKKTALIKDLASIREKITEHEETIQRKNDEISSASKTLKKAEKDHNDLNKSMVEVSERLDDIQTQNMALEKEKLPELAKNLCLEIKRAMKCIEAMQSDLRNQCGIYESDIGMLNEKISDAEIKVKVLKEKYDDLTGRYNNYNDDIKDLKKQISDLEGKDIENMHATYTKQLEQRIFDLEDKEKECEKLNKSIQESERKLNTLQEKVGRLKMLSEEKEKALSEKKRIEEEMLGLDAEYLQREIEKNQNRAKILERIKVRLLAGIGGLEAALGEEETHNKMNEINYLSDLLPKLRKYLDDLQIEMVNLADTVRIEENRL